MGGLSRFTWSRKLSCELEENVSDGSNGSTGAFARVEKAGEDSTCKVKCGGAAHVSARRLDASCPVLAAVRGTLPVCQVPRANEKRLRSSFDGSGDLRNFQPAITHRVDSGSQPHYFFFIPRMRRR